MLGRRENIPARTFVEAPAKTAFEDWFDPRIVAQVNRNDQRFTKVVVHAARAFLTLGYERASLDQIASCAGVSKATIYNIFGSKQNLLREVLHFSFEATSRELQMPIRLDCPVREALIEYSVSYFTALFREHDGRPPFHKMCSLVVASSLVDRRIAVDLFSRYEATGFPPVRAFLGAKTRSGEMQFDDLEFQVRLFFEFVIGSYDVFFGIVQVPAAEDIVARAETRVDIFLRTCIPWVGKDLTV